MSPIVQLENKEMREEISLDGSDKRWWDYRQLFNTREGRYRSMIVISMAFIGQVSLSEAQIWNHADVVCSGRAMGLLGTTTRRC